MMYWYWTRKGIRPSEFKKIPPGEMTIIRGFYELEIEEEIERRKNSIF